MYYEFLLDFLDVQPRFAAAGDSPDVLDLAKEREVENIRAIARGREAGLSVEEIEEELVIT